jgi:ABC-type glycerol-3-phosphate transport system substrate-binding protein
MSKRTLLFLIGLLALCVTPLTAQEAEGDVITIRQWDGFLTQSPAWERAIAEFEAANPNINIERQVQTNTGELLPLAFEGGSAPDIFSMPAADQIRAYIDSEWLFPISTMPDWEEFLATFPNPDNAIGEGVNEFEGEVYTMPFDAPFFYLQMYVNTALYEQAGLVNEAGEPELPVTWEQVVENSRAVNQATGAFGYGFSPDNWAFASPFWMCQRTNMGFGGWAGAGWNPIEGRFDFAENECTRAVIDSIITMRDEGLIPPNALSLNDEQVRVMFAEGQIAHILNGFWVIPGFEQTHPDFTEYTSTVLPLVGTETPGGGYGLGAGGGFMGINPNTENLEEVWAWYKYIYSEEFGRIWAEEKAGLSIFTPGDPTQYTTVQNRGYFETSTAFVPEPNNNRRNADVADVQITVLGPQLIDILTGIYTGQITDVDAALTDLEQRSQDALDLALSDAQANGLNVTLEDYICRDWEYGVPYPSDGRCFTGYPGAEGVSSPASTEEADATEEPGS